MKTSVRAGCAALIFIFIVGVFIHSEKHYFFLGAGMKNFQTPTEGGCSETWRFRRVPIFNLPETIGFICPANNMFDFILIQCFSYIGECHFHRNSRPEFTHIHRAFVGFRHRNWQPYPRFGYGDSNIQAGHDCDRASFIHNKNRGFDRVLSSYIIQPYMLDAYFRPMSGSEFGLDCVNMTSEVVSLPAADANQSRSSNRQQQSHENQEGIGNLHLVPEHDPEFGTVICACITVLCGVACQARGRFLWLSRYWIGVALWWTLGGYFDLSSTIGL